MLMRRPAQRQALKLLFVPKKRVPEFVWMYLKEIERSWSLNGQEMKKNITDGLCGCVVGCKELISLREHRMWLKWLENKKRVKLWRVRELEVSNLNSYQVLAHFSLLGMESSSQNSLSPVLVMRRLLLWSVGQYPGEGAPPRPRERAGRAPAAGSVRVRSWGPKQRWNTDTAPSDVSVSLECCFWGFWCKCSPWHVC